MLHTFTDARGTATLTVPLDIPGTKPQTIPVSRAVFSDYADKLDSRLVHLKPKAFGCSNYTVPRSVASSAFTMIVKRGQCTFARKVS